MDQRICLDTDAAIEIIKGSEKALQIRGMIENSTVFVSSITSFELRLRKTNLDVVESFLRDVFIIPFDDHAANISSRIHKELEKKGKRISIKDLFIGSSAITSNCTVLTFNKKDFVKLEEFGLALL